MYRNNFVTPNDPHSNIESKEGQGPSQKASLYSFPFKFPFSPLKSSGEIPDSPAEGQTDDTNHVGGVMWPLVFLLKILGHCPLSYSTPEVGNNSEKVKESDEKDYHSALGSLNFPVMSTGIYPWSEEEEVKGEQNESKEYRIIYKSPFLLWSLALGSLYVYCWATLVLEMTLGSEGTPRFDSGWAETRDFFNHHVYNRTVQGFPSDQPDNANKGTVTSMIFLFKAVMSTYGLSQILELFASWAESPQFAVFLNNWKMISKDFLELCPTYKLDQVEGQLLKQRNHLFIYHVVIPSLLQTPVLLVPWLGDPSPLWKILVTKIVPFICHGLILPLLEDTKVIMSYNILSNAMEQMREGVAYNIRWEKLTPDKVKSWRRLLQSVRLEAVMVGNLQKLHQLLLLSGSIVMTTTFAFMMLNVDYGGPGNWQLSVLTFGFVCGLIGRTYRKILAANEITNNEEMIAQELLEVEPAKNDLTLQLEIKFMHDMIQQNPSIISFGNYVTLNKSLILSIASQVVTYLIVLMQFSQSQGS